MKLSNFWGNPDGVIWSPRVAENWSRFPSTYAPVRWQSLKDNPEVEVKLLKYEQEHYLLARSRPRRHKERAIRRRQRHGLARGLAKLRKRIEDGRLKDRDKILESLGGLKGRFPWAASVLDDHRREIRPGHAEMWDLGSGKVPGRIGSVTAPTCCEAIKTAGRRRSSGRPTSS